MTSLKERIAEIKKIYEACGEYKHIKFNTGFKELEDLLFATPEMFEIITKQQEIISKLQSTMAAQASNPANPGWVNAQECLQEVNKMIEG